MNDLHWVSELIDLYLLLIVPQGRGAHLSHCGRRGRPEQKGADEAAAVAALLCSAVAKVSSRVIWLEENTLPDVVLGALCYFLFCISYLTWLQSQS
jgi:uncharacterized protein involved in response to NO